MDMASAKQPVHKWLIRAIGVVQIVGSFFGIEAVMGVVSQSIAVEDLPIVLFFLYVLMAGYFFFGAYAGLVLLESHGVDRRFAIIFQAVQVPIITLPGISFHVGVGFYAFFILGADGGNLNPMSVIANWGTDWRISLLGQQTSWALGINVFSVLILALLMRFRVATPRYRD